MHRGHSQSGWLFQHSTEIFLKGTELAKNVKEINEFAKSRRNKSWFETGEEGLMDNHDFWLVGDLVALSCKAWWGAMANIPKTTTRMMRCFVFTNNNLDKGRVSITVLFGRRQFQWWKRGWRIYCVLSYQTYCKGLFFLYDTMKMYPLPPSLPQRSQFPSILS